MKLVKPIDGDIKYISDLHFFHDNIIKHCNRPCTQEEHEDWIVNLLNSSISPEDDVYHLGDFSFGSRVKLPELKRVMSRLNGTWHFILGNHDNEKQLEALCAGTKHKVVGFYLSFHYNDTKFVLLHYPMESWDGKYRKSIHLHGHTHDTKITEIPNRYNVCLDYEHKVYSIDDFLPS